MEPEARLDKGYSIKVSAPSSNNWKGNCWLPCLTEQHFFFRKQLRVCLCVRRVPFPPFHVITFFSPHLLHELFQHCFSLSKGQRKLILLLIESAKFVVLCAYFIPQRSCIFILYIVCFGIYCRCFVSKCHLLNKCLTKRRITLCLCCTKCNK